jgi:hypothetical protein
MSTRKYITKDDIETITIRKYQANGRGITFEDVIKEFSVNKAEAQRKLKYFYNRKVLFTAKELILEDITLLPNTSPQQYFPTCKKADVIEDLSKRKNVLVKPTEVTSSKTLFSQLTSSKALLSKVTSSDAKTASNASLSTLEGQKAQNLLDVLFSLGKCPLYIHKLQLQVSLPSRYYNDIQKNCSKYNKAKQHEEKIGSSNVKYLVYPNGKTMVYVASSNNPFKIDDESDESILYSYLGQVRDRLLYLVTDPNERAVPPITEWILTGNHSVPIFSW